MMRPQLLQVHLLVRFVDIAEHMTDRANGGQAAHLFGEVLHVIPGALQRLRHKQHLDGVLRSIGLRQFKVPKENEVAIAIMSVSARSTATAASMNFV